MRTALMSSWLHGGPEVSMAGVRLLGARPHAEVLAYLQHADGLIVPHIVDRFTDSWDL